MRKFSERKELEWMLRGLGILGTGGGGDPDTWGASIIDADLAKGRVYQLVNPEEVGEDALVVSGGYLGSVAEDRALDRVVDEWEHSFELECALREMETLIGRRIDYLVPFEMGGGNTPVILSAGARLGIPVVDGDALGRAAPETQMTSFIGHGVKLTPMPLVDSKGTVVIVKESNDIFFPDEVGRFVVSTKRGLMANSHYPMSGAELKRSVIPNTITKAIDLGGFVTSLTGQPGDKLASLSEHLEGFPLLWGKVTVINGENRGGFYFAHVRVKGSGGFKGRTVDLTIKNEVMCARLDGRPIVIFPDLILLLDPDTNKGVMTPDIKEGRELLLVAVPCHPRLREALETEAGARAFASDRYGERIDYRPVEKLIGGTS
ncbi:DUF917 domain-containing protein [Candidatus Bipolaricaulota bacterium]|nr:DUF917 domain-containing protein [Candidatus Bipolaricaulota bacterium]MCK4600357.1 DUF917 domain-containing protein [Candidatus Bipolaricaulota bacterium]